MRSIHQKSQWKALDGCVSLGSTLLMDQIGSKMSKLFVPIDQIEIAKKLKNRKKGTQNLSKNMTISNRTILSRNSRPSLKTGNTHMSS